VTAYLAQRENLVDYVLRGDGSASYSLNHELYSLLIELALRLLLLRPLLADPHDERFAFSLGNNRSIHRV
jgi:hypothetical protein